MAVTYVVLATLLFGVWAVAEKEAVARTAPLAVQWMYLLPSVATLPLLYWIAGPSSHADAAAQRTAMPWAVGAGACGLLATLLVIFALRDMSASVVTTITSFYPAVTLLIAVAMRQETFTPTKALGMALVIAGVVVISRAEEPAKPATPPAPIDRITE